MSLLLPTIVEPVYPVEQSLFEPGRRYAWTGRERQVLRERYIRDGLNACLAMLPARARGGILNECARLGLRRQKPHAPPRESNEMLDAAIRRFYAGGAKGTLKEFCKRWGVTRQWASVRAAEIGARRTSTTWAEWSSAELALVEAHATKKAVTISRILAKHGYARTASAINCKLHDLELDRLDPDRLTANQIARCMGVDNHVPVRWITHHGLKATRDGTHWSIKRKDLRAWLINTRTWDHRKADRDFLVEILSGDSNARTAPARQKAG